MEKILIIGKGFLGNTTSIIAKTKNFQVFEASQKSDIRIDITNIAQTKGLEFDTVFAVDLEDLSLQGAELDNAKMDLYVLFSRPRQELFLCCSELTEGQLPDIFLRDEFQELQQGLLDFDTDIKEEHEEEHE